MENPESSSQKWLLIVNPNAGRRKGEKDWPKISKLLKKNNIEGEVHFTRHRHHAVLIAKTGIEDGFRKIIVAGGDGTLNEVVNGIFLQTKYPTTDITLAMIPIGTGNDWGRMYGIKPDYEQAVQVIKEGKTFIQDTGRVMYKKEKLQKCRYFINIAGMGYDAIVAEKTNRMKDQGKGGPMSYLVNLLSSLFSYSPNNIRLTVDGNTSSFRVFSLSVGICRYNGGGMMQLPKALPDDGLFDITVIDNIGKMEVISQLKNLYNGSFINHPKVKTYVGKDIRIESASRLILEADGESLGSAPFQFEMIPKSVKIITGAKRF